MSRIGKKAVEIPDKVKVNVGDGGQVSVEGPKGQPKPPETFGGFFFCPDVGDGEAVKETGRAVPTDGRCKGRSAQQQGVLQWLPVP